MVEGINSRRNGGERYGIFHILVKDTFSSWK
jgi:hypothetical protein